MVGNLSCENSSLGAPLALGENFGEQQTPSLVLSPKFSPNTKFPPQILELDSNKGDSNKSTDLSLRGRITDSHEAIQNKNQSARSANPIKSFCYLLLLPNEESPFFTDSALDSQSIRATNRNGRNCGGGFVFARIFGIETRLGVCEIPKILTSAKDAPKSELTYNDSIYLRITRDSTQITHESTTFKANLI